MSLGFFLFFIFGWTYYMVATILMRGTIFVGLRAHIDKRADNEKIFRFLREMLGCLMCTATEAAFWTLGVTAIIIGLRYHLVNRILSELIKGRINLPLVAEIPLAFMAGFALSLAVAGEAWGIKCIVEHQEEKFLSLREEFRAKEAELLQKISELEQGKEASNGFDFDLEIR